MLLKGRAAVVKRVARRTVVRRDMLKNVTALGLGDRIEAGDHPTSSCLVLQSYSCGSTSRPQHNNAVIYSLRHPQPRQLRTSHDGKRSSTLGGYILKNGEKPSVSSVTVRSRLVRQTVALHG